MIMATFEMVMPKMGESIMEGTILSWLKKEGDKIEQDESVLEVATDKVDTEVPAIQSGILKKILAHEGEIVEVGKPIALIEIEGENSSPVEENSSSLTQNQSEDKLEIEQAIPEHTSVLVSNPVSSSGEPAIKDSRFYSPLVLSIAKKESISREELSQIPGTGKEGRVTKNDILGYLRQRTPDDSSGSLSSGFSDQVYISGDDEIMEMDRMRKMIAQRMLDSKKISAHVTSFVEADVTHLVFWRNKIKTEYQKKEGEPITYTPVFVQAIAKALKDYPMMNISVEGDKIIKKKQINIGIAVALQNGNLIVPVIRNADQYSLKELSKKINDLALRARNLKLSPDELKGGTYTLSNVGSFGNIMGTPIIVQPQVAILAVGTIVKKPAVIETPTGDVIGIRHKMFLSHSYDHRVVDGALGGLFVRKVADYLEKFDMDTPI